MQVHQQIPPPCLRDYVSLYTEIVHDLAPDEELIVPFSAVGRSQLVFYLKNPFKCYKKGKEMPIHKGTFFIQNALPYAKHFAGPTVGFAIEFTPVGLHALWHLPMEELSEQTLDLDCVENNSVQQIVEQLQESGSFEQRVDVVNTFLINRLRKALWQKWIKPDKRIQFAANCIIANPYGLAMGQIADTIHYSERQFRRCFIQETGLSPKFFLRIHRFIKTRKLLGRQPNPNWQYILSETGYFDQAHLIKDFTFFTEKSPLNFVKNEPGMHDFFYDR